VEANEGLELYLNVPIQQAPQLKTGLPVRLVDDTGKELARSAISFISPSADQDIQTVLAKVPLSASSGFRTSVRARAGDLDDGADPHRPGDVRPFASTVSTSRSSRSTAWRINGRSRWATCSATTMWSWAA